MERKQRFFTMAGIRRKKHVLLPLLQTLLGMTPSQRTIIIAHLNEETQDLLMETIKYVMFMGRKKLPQDKLENLGEALAENKCDLRYVCDKGKDCRRRRQRMRRMGGFPLGLILSTAIPMLLNLFTK